MNQMNAVANKIFNAQKLVFVTGAGVSAGSGLPTYRGPTGLYNDNLTEEGYTIEQIFSKEMYIHRPELLAKYTADHFANLKNIQPASAHKRIAQLACPVITQNIDQLHTKAGSAEVAELHGRSGFDCPYCGHIDVLTCPNCGSLALPSFVLFGANLDPDVLTQAHYWASTADCLIFIGTSCSFDYIAEYYRQARWNGAAIFEINPETTIISSHVDIHLKLEADVALESIFDMS